MRDLRKTMAAYHALGIALEMLHADKTSGRGTLIAEREVRKAYDALADQIEGPLSPAEGKVLTFPRVGKSHFAFNGDGPEVA